MSFSVSSAARRRIFAQISLALSSRTSEPSQMMRSLSSLSKTLVATRGSAMFTPDSVVVSSNLPARRRRPARVRPGQSERDGCGSIRPFHAYASDRDLLGCLVRSGLLGRCLLRGRLLRGRLLRRGLLRGGLLRRLLLDGLGLVGLVLVFDGGEAGQVDGGALRVDDGDLAERNGQRLVAGDLADH